MLKALKVRNQKLKGDQSGFTIVELIIVIAIAALILVIALAVVPALRRSGRNSARQADIRSMQGQLIEWSSNNGNRLPGSDLVFVNEVVANIEQSHDWPALTGATGTCSITAHTTEPACTGATPTPGVWTWTSAGTPTSDGEGIYYGIWVSGTTPAATIQRPGIDGVHFWKGAECATDRFTSTTGANSTYAAGAASILRKGTTTSVAIIYAVEGDQNGNNQIYQCRDDVQ